VHSHIRDLVSPLVGLGLDVCQIFERSQGPEVVANVVDGAFFDLSLLMSLAQVTRQWNRPEGSQKGKESIIKANEGAVSLDHCGEHIIVDQSFCRPLEKHESIEQTPVQGFLSLGMGELQVEHTAVALDECHTVELSGSIPVR